MIYVEKVRIWRNEVIEIIQGTFVSWFPLQVEASIALRDRPEQPVDTESYSCISHADRNDGQCEAQNIAIFIDGSSTSFHALQYTIGSLCHKKKDHIYIVTVILNGTHHNEAEHTLQQAYDYAHNAGKVSLLTFE